jgi:serine/threonine protein kinase/outer membrane biosynthesis protein TonB
MMRLRDPIHDRTLADDLEEKVTHETPTVRSSPASYEGLQALADADSEVVKVCKSCAESAPADAEFCPDCGDELVSIRKAPDMYLDETVGGKYHIAEKIGEGGMGVVYLGLNESVGQKVAVKFLSKKFADDEGIVRRFINEAKSYCRVSHPNAVTLHDYGQHDDGALYIITEFVEGRNLTQTLQENGPLGADVALDVSIQIAEVLSAAHHEGIIHRDLKPDNVMLMPSPRGRYAVKVLDFGIAKIVDDEDGPNTETGSVFGTPEFMSPEQARGDEADPRSDIYALGVIMFYMLTGKLPFRGKNKLVVLNKQLNEAPPRPSEMLDDIDVPPRFEAVIMKCLNKGRGERYDSADDLLEALEDLRIPGGQDTDKVGLAGGEKDITPALGEIRGSTVRLGDRGDDADPHADTLAAPLGADHDEPAQIDLESIEMWREQRETAGSSRDSHRVAIVAAGGLFVFVLVATIAFFSTSDSRSVDVEGVLLAGQMEGMLAVAENSLDEGHLDAAKSALATTREWAEDGELTEDVRARRQALQAAIDELEDSRGAFLSAVKGGECNEAKVLLGGIAGKSEGLAGRLRGKLATCEAPEDETPTAPTPTKPVAKPAPAPEPAAPRPEESVVEESEPEPNPAKKQNETAQEVESPAEAEPLDEEVVPSELPPEPDPPKLASDSEGDGDGEAPDEPAERENAEGDEVPDGMALPPKKIGD